MRQTSTALVSIGLALAALAAMGIGAQAASRPLHHHHRYRHMARSSVIYGDQAPLTVNKRSWLDPGPVVPVGSQENYVVEGTYFRQTPDEKYFPSRFHEDAMPRPLYVPGGNMTPLVTFSTPRDPF